MSQPQAMPMADRISSLPDTIICHILSFLLTKETVATSILSKRWNHLWLSVPVLDFEPEVASSGFEKSVYFVILSRDSNQPIKKFRLSFHCRSPYDAYTMKLWVNTALQRGVEHLELLTNFDCTLNLPSGVLSCKTLVVLKLIWFDVTVLSSVHLPSLKVLHLEAICFSKRRYVTDILSACPVLEDLQAIDFDYDDPFDVGEYKSLPHLVRADIFKFSVHLEAVCNVEFLRLHEDDENEYSNYMENGVSTTNKCLVPMFHNLTRIEFIFRQYPKWHEVVEVIKNSPKLQNIVITKENLLFPFEEDGDLPYPQSIPTCMLSNLRTCCLNYYIGSKCELQFASYIMENARSLKTITICCYSSLNRKLKHKALQELSLCTRSSATCKLSFK